MLPPSPRAADLGRFGCQRRRAAEAGGDDGDVVDTTMADSLVAAAATLSQAMAVELLPGEAPVSVVSPAGIAIKTASGRLRRRCRGRAV